MNYEAKKQYMNTLRKEYFKLILFKITDIFRL